MTTTASAPAWLDEPGAPLRQSRLTSLVRGRRDDPAWVRPALLALLGSTALLYLWGLGASGWANGFYSAAVEAGSKSWKAFFFGSFDSSNFITVDKPPASLWVMDLSARIFGVNAWSVLVPQALEGVAAVGLLFATVRRRFGPGAGLIAGAVMATTPVAVLMFRFNNPDALLVLLLVGAAYATVRATEKASTRWLILVGVLIGFGFITKMMQAFLVVPGFALVYLVAAPATVKKRIVDLLVAGVAMFVSAGWWVAVVTLWPASSRPYIGGSQHNSILELIFGYNGFGRLTGNETGSVGGGAATAGTTGQWGPTGITRLFGSDMGGQISWLIPTALVFLVAGLAFTLRRKRTDLDRAHWILWGSWLLVTGLTFSFAKGIIHPYYTVALAPAIGALVGMGAVAFWRNRDSMLARLTLTAGVTAASCWSYVLLQRNSGGYKTLGAFVLIAGLAVAALFAVIPWVAQLAGDKHTAIASKLTAVLAVAGLVVGVGGPSAYALQTASVPHSGSIPSAGPTASGGNGFGGGGGGRGGFGGGGAGGGRTRTGTGTGTGTLPGAGTVGGGAGTTRGQGGFGGGGGAGGLLDASTPSAALVTALKAGASSYTWVLATVGANNAAGYQLATGDAVMAIGGFNGSDPTPTLATFQQLVLAGKVHYYIGGGGLGGGQNATGTATAITTWVEANYTATTIGGTTVYDLTAGTTGTSGTATTSTTNT
jgi:4-amino-4-deoxy-L-arabinose transferase-like glycosyltransferase